MKKIKRLSKSKFPLYLFALIVLIPGLHGCAVTNTLVQADVSSKHSETEFGWGGTVLMGTELPIANTSVYGLASYHRYSFTGGHDNLWQFGVQARKALGENKNWWMGGELTYLQDKSVEDMYTDSKANGYSAGVIAGRKLPLPILNASVFSGVSFIHFGDFKNGSEIIYPSGNSVQLKVGVEIDIPFF